MSILSFVLQTFGQWFGNFREIYFIILALCILYAIISIIKEMISFDV